ncbi:MAG: hypothetical protein Ct9H90mP23_1230 [Methanobacteriota archaeon]|nr:MAG: hypothetical protein Ct9H90mP23_1230 [Euryarchaeota archaeon]
MMVANASEEKAQEALGIEFRTPGTFQSAGNHQVDWKLDRGTLNWLLQ